MAGIGVGVVGVGATVIVVGAVSGGLAGGVTGVAAGLAVGGSTGKGAVEIPDFIAEDAHRCEYHCICFHAEFNHIHDDHSFVHCIGHEGHLSHVKDGSIH